jgi:pectin methylesterase-like acyl-CoA thioesterase
MLFRQGITHKIKIGRTTVNGNIRSVATTLVLCAGLIAGIGKPAGATTWCVNPGGTGGCFAKIGSPVSAALPNDSINVAPGTYKEDVVIGKALSLVGANPKNTIINASGLSNGIYIDGLDNPGLSNVVVTGFTVENTENWWGCHGGPGAQGCASVEGSGVLFTPWLTWPFVGN